MTKNYTHKLTNNQFSDILPPQLWGMFMHDSNANTTLYPLMQQEQATAGEVITVVHYCWHILSIWSCRYRAV
jgi:hypothetical protein